MSDIDFECTECGKCCHDLRLPLTVVESIAWLERGGQMELLCEAIPWPVEPDADNAQAAYKRARSSLAASGTLPVRISIVLAAAFAGACPNLRADMRCGIYEQRPRVCRIYPAEINPFVTLMPENKGCPPEAWQKKPLLRQGKLVDATTIQLIGDSRAANQREAPLRMQLCLALGVTHAALANEGFVIHTPSRDALLAALRELDDATPGEEPVSQWTFVSNRAETIDTLHSVDAVSVQADSDVAADWRYYGFFPPS